MQTDAYLFCCKLVRLQYNAICVIWYCVTLNEINCSEEFTVPIYPHITTDCKKLLLD